MSIVDNVLLNTMKTAELIAAPAATTNTSSSDGAMVPVGNSNQHRNGNRNSEGSDMDGRGYGGAVSGVVDVGEGDDVLGDVRR